MEEEGRKEEKTDHSGYIVDLKMSELDVISRLNRLDHPFPSTCKNPFMSNGGEIES